MNAEDIFSQFFGGGGGGFGGLGGMFGGGGGMRAPQGPPKVKTIMHKHRVSLEDIYRGKVSKLALQRSIICKTCDGRGGKEGAVKKCTGCDGVGVKLMMRQMGPMIQRFQTACPDCSGEGEIIRERDRCKACMGKKTLTERKILHVPVDKGVKNGQRIDFPREGDQVPGAEPGDVIFEIEQKPHERFQRKDDDLFYHAEIDLLTALAGGSIYIEHLDDRWLKVDIVPGEVIAPSMSLRCRSRLEGRLTNALNQTPSRSSASKACPHTDTTTLVTYTSNSTSSSLTASVVPTAPRSPTTRSPCSSGSCRHATSASFLQQTRRLRSSRLRVSMTHVRVRGHMARLVTMRMRRWAAAERGCSVPASSRRYSGQGMASSVALWKGKRGEGRPSGTKERCWSTGAKSQMRAHDDGSP